MIEMRRKFDVRRGETKYNIKFSSLEAIAPAPTNGCISPGGFSGAHKMKRAALLSLLLWACASCTKWEEWQEQQLNASEKSVLYEIKYGPNIRHTLTIALPAHRNNHTPVVVFIHGGAWLFGDKSVHIPEMQQLADSGMACAIINYRFASDVAHIHYPDMIQDVQLAIQFIQQHADRWQVADNRFGLAGQSAGGHLALCTAYALNDDHAIKAVVSWAGVANLLDPEQAAVSGGRQIAQTLVGRNLTTAADTTAYQQACPYYLAQTNSVPTLLLQGTKDVAVPYGSVARFYQHLHTLNTAHQMETFNGEGHLWFGTTLNTARTETIHWFRLYL